MEEIVPTKVPLSRYFNGWQNACLKFVEHKMGKSIIKEEEEKLKGKGKGLLLKNKPVI